MLPADERRQTACAPSCEPALGTAFAQDLPDLNFFAEALELGAPNILQLKQPGDQALGSWPDHHLVRSGEGLKSGGQVRRLADHRLLLSCTLADEVAHYHLARGNADADRQCVAICGAQPADGLWQLDPRPDRALGVILVRLWVAEVHEHAVAHVLGNEAVVAGDCIGDASMIHAD